MLGIISYIISWAGVDSPRRCFSMLGQGQGLEGHKHQCGDLRLGVAGGGGGSETISLGTAESNEDRISGKRKQPNGIYSPSCGIVTTGEDFFI